MNAKVVLSVTSVLSLICGAASAQALPPTVSGLPATVYVSSDGTVVGGPLDGMPYFGVLIGTSGNDVIVGTNGADVILAMGGDDLVTAGGGNDWIDGSFGDDIIDGAAGFDFGIGGPGYDTCTSETEIRILCERRAPLPAAPTDAAPPVPTTPTAGGLFASLPYLLFGR